MPVVSALGYTILYVRDVEASLDFYGRAFGRRKRSLGDRQSPMFATMPALSLRSARP
jgi:catechol 2,3-dioxygenase-like lactoylglutathione lyase family enzyme